MNHRNKDFFEQKFIFEGYTLHELSIFFNIDWATADSWRVRHGLPKHKDTKTIIERYGLEVLENIKQHKKEQYIKGNSAKSREYKGKTLVERFGEEKAQEIKNKMSDSNKGKVKSKSLRKKLSEERKGDKNPNWKGGLYSKHVFQSIDRVYISEHVAQTWNRLYVMDSDYTCAKCGKRSLDAHAHHLLSFSLIFYAVCTYLEKEGRLSTMEVAKEMHSFHKENYENIYTCLCRDCHAIAHSVGSYNEREHMNNSRIHLLAIYNFNPEPSLEKEEGAETIETIRNEGVKIHSEITE